MGSEVFAENPLAIFLDLTVGGIGLFFALATLDYLLLYVLYRRRFNPGYLPDRAENRKAMRYSLWCLLGNAVVTTPIHWMIATGHSQIYFDVSDHGWGWLLVSALMMIVVTETAIYWIHRWLHTDSGWRLHKYHHEFKTTTPWVGVAFHPLDSFSQALPHHLCVFLFPVHANVYLLSVALVTVWAVSIHDRQTLVRWKGVNYTAHHTLHHWYSDYNFGQYFTFWDRLGGTYRDPDSCRHEIPDAINQKPRAWRGRR